MRISIREDYPHIKHIGHRNLKNYMCFDPHDFGIIIEGHTNTHIYYMFLFETILGNHNDLYVKHEKTETAVRYRNMTL